MLCPENSAFRREIYVAAHSGRRWEWGDFIYPGCCPGLGVVGLSARWSCTTALRMDNTKPKTQHPKHSCPGLGVAELSARIACVFMCALHEATLALTPSERASSYCHALDFARNYQSSLVVAVESECDFEVENILSVAIVFARGTFGRRLLH